MMKYETYLISIVVKRRGESYHNALQLANYPEAIVGITCSLCYPHTYTDSEIAALRLKELEAGLKRLRVELSPDHIRRYLLPMVDYKYSTTQFVTSIVRAESGERVKDALRRAVKTDTVLAVVESKPFVTSVNEYTLSQVIYSELIANAYKLGDNLTSYDFITPKKLSDVVKIETPDGTFEMNLNLIKDDPEAAMKKLYSDIVNAFNVSPFMKKPEQEEVTVKFAVTVTALKSDDEKEYPNDIIQSLQANEYYGLVSEMKLPVNDDARDKIVAEIRGSLEAMSLDASKMADELIKIAVNNKEGKHE